MTGVEIKDNAVVVNGNTIDVGSRILDAQATASIVLILIDPDSYLEDPEYRCKRRSGLPAIRNLQAFSLRGERLWDAEMPEEADYYHTIVNADPIEVDSFSSFRCQIDPRTGKIAAKRFMK
jgi:hypothetical protein